MKAMISYCDMLFWYRFLGNDALYLLISCSWNIVNAAWVSLSVATHCKSISFIAAQNGAIVVGFISRAIYSFRYRFYPRPVLAYGYCRCLRLCVCLSSLSACLSVFQSRACPRDNWGPVQARVAKFGPKMQKTLVKVRIVLGNWPWPSRSNLT